MFFNWYLDHLDLQAVILTPFTIVWQMSSRSFLSVFWGMFSFRAKLMRINVLSNLTNRYLILSMLLSFALQYTYTAPSQIVSFDAYSDGNTHTQVWHLLAGCFTVCCTCKPFLLMVFNPYCDDVTSLHSMTSLTSMTLRVYPNCTAIFQRCSLAIMNIMMMGKRSYLHCEHKSVSTKWGVLPFHNLHPAHRDY